MKNVLTFLFVTLFIGSSFSQSFIDKYFQNLVDDDNSTAITVSGDMFRYAAVLVDESHNDEINTKEVLNGVKSLQFVALEESVDPEVEYQKGIRTIPERMNEMVSVKSKGSRLKVFIDETNDIVYEIIALGTDENSFFVGSILCEIKLEDVNEVFKQIQAQNGKTFKQLWDVEFDDLNVYPNPASSTGSIAIEIPESLKGGEGTLIDETGKSVKTFKLIEVEEQVSLDNLSPGNYILHVAKDGIQLQKKILIVN
ncbi:MAG: hypothetical protein ACJA01_000234 [Saprospiraceae bacterium]|jgi:hypothetical protein